MSKLDNGMRVLVQQNRAAPVVALQLWVDAGSADDPPRRAGAAHLIEHMVFKSEPLGGIAREIEAAGGDINAWTSFDQTVYHAVMPSRFFGHGLRVLARAIREFHIAPQELTKEVQVVREEMHERDDDPGQLVGRLLFEKAFAGHVYRRPVIGTPRSLAGLDLGALRRFYAKMYRPERLVLVVVGAVDAATVRKSIREAFGGKWANGRGSAVAPSTSGEGRGRRLRLAAEHHRGEEAHIALGFRIPALIHEATPALDLGAVVLGHGDSSRLVRRVQKEQQLVTDISAYAFSAKRGGLLVVNASARPENALRAVRAIVHEALSLGELEVTSAELARAHTIIESDHVYQRETMQGQARKLGFYQLVAGDENFDADYQRRVAAVDAAALQRVLGRYLVVGNLTVTMVTPRQKDAQVEVLRRAVNRAAQPLRQRRAKREKLGGGVVKVQLANGARLLVQRDTSVPLVAMRAVWNGGLRFENARNNGISTLLASLVTRGTMTRSADQIAEEIEGMAGVLTGFSGRNSFGLRGEMLARSWSRGLELFADCVLHPAFAPREIERQRRQLLDDILAQRDSAGARALQLFARAMYQHHPYRFDPLGTVSSVAGLKRQTLVRYYRSHFHPSKMVFAVVGDVDPDAVVERFTQLFSSQAAGRDAAPDVVADPEPAAGQRVQELIAEDKQQAHVVVGFRGATIRSSDRFALEVLSAVLSGQGGRLFVELRDQQGLAYTVSAFSLEGIEPGYVAAYAATSPENVARVVAGIEQQFARLRERPVGAAELRRVKRYLVGTHEISLQRKATVAAYLAFDEAYGLGYAAHRRYGEAIGAVTAEQLRRVARKYLAEDRLVVAVATPERRSEGAESRLPPGRDAGVTRREADKGRAATTKAAAKKRDAARRKKRRRSKSRSRTKR